MEAFINVWGVLVYSKLGIGIDTVGANSSEEF